MQNLYKSKLVLAIYLSFLCLSTTTNATEWTERVQISGFASAIYRQTNVEPHFNGTEDSAGINEDGSYQGTRFGLNINARITDDLNIASQFLTAREVDDYTTKLDWGFLSLVLSDEFTLRAGKIKFPVGIINEYIDVGYAYPWISPPLLFYSEETSGPQATREAYSGTSVFWSYHYNDWTFSTDVYYGEVILSSMTIHKLSGVTFRSEWNDAIAFQASTYSGEMHNDMMAAMNGRNHSANVFGVSADWLNIVAYIESAHIDMDDFLVGKGKAWYATVGYRFGKILPHITVQEFEKAKGTGSPQDQRMTTFGLRYELRKNTSLKIEYGTLKTNQNKGLFTLAPGKDAKLLGFAFDVVF